MPPDSTKVTEEAEQAQWLSPAETPFLVPGEVHVWRAPLDGTTSIGWQWLSTDEQERAGRFVFEKDRARFATARSTLRLLLGRYLSVQPESITFHYSSNGKPTLVRNPLGIHFNVSHSHTMAVYAFTVGTEIGVDVEYLGRAIRGEEIAERFFSAMEIASLRSLPPPQQHRGFFNCWTRKEAFVKATGEGIALGLDQFSVSLAPDEPAGLIETQIGAADAGGWSILHLDPAPDYVGAVALQGPVWKLSCWSV